MLRRDEKLAERLVQGRARKLEIMDDTCRITKAGTGPRVLDGDLVYTDPPRVVVYEGPCRLQVRADVNSNVVEVTAGEKEWAYQTLTLEIPVTAPAAGDLTPAQMALYPDGAIGDPTEVRIDHTAEMLTSKFDPGVPGRRFQIRAIHHKTHATSRRFRITEAM